MVARGIIITSGTKGVDIIYILRIYSLSLYCNGIVVYKHAAALRCARTRIASTETGALLIDFQEVIGITTHPSTRAPCIYTIWSVT